MRKKRSKLVCGLLTLAMVLSLVPATAWADETGKNEITVTDESSFTSATNINGSSPDTVITLGNDIDLSSETSTRTVNLYQKDLVIDLNNHTLKTKAMIIFCFNGAGKLTIKNGTVDNVSSGSFDVFKFKTDKAFGATEEGTVAVNLDNVKIQMAYNGYIFRVGDADQSEVSGGSVNIRNSVFSNATLFSSMKNLSVDLEKVTLNVNKTFDTGSIGILANNDSDDTNNETVDQVISEGCTLKYKDKLNGEKTADRTKKLKEIRCPLNDTESQIVISGNTSEKYNITVGSGKAYNKWDEEIAQATKGEVIKIVANPAESGSEFVNWTGEGVTFADASAATTTFTMPDSAVEVTANYQSGPHFVSGPESPTCYYDNDSTTKGYTKFTFSHPIKKYEVCMRNDADTDWNSPVTRGEEGIAANTEVKAEDLYSGLYSNGSKKFLLKVYYGEGANDFVSREFTCTWAKRPESTKTLTGIAVTTPPTKTTYTAGENFDPAGMVVTATYSNGETAAVTGYTYSPNGALTTSNTEITISYTEGVVTKTATQTITVNAAGHTHDYDTTTWLYDGTQHWHKCTGCDAKTDIADHSGGTATCTAQAVCTACGQAYGTLDATNHSGEVGSEWKFNAEKHWNEYSCCNAKANEADHVYTDKTDTTCNTCGYERTTTPTEKTSITEALVPVSDLTKTFKYNIAQEPIFGGTLTKDTDYTVSYEVKAGSAGELKDGKPYGAGTYVVTVTGIGSYKDSFTKDFVIEKANLGNETEGFSAKAGEEKTEGIYDEDIAEMTFGVLAVSDSDGILDGTPELIKASDLVSLKFKFKADAETGKTATVTIPLTGPNYVWNVVITLTVEDSSSAPDALSGTVAITGTAKYGETLTADTTGITNNTGTLSYQWKRDGVAIDSATNSSYTLTLDDIGEKITVSVSSSVETGTITSDSVEVELADAPEEPVISPNGGTFKGSQKITLTCATEGTTIIYTRDKGTTTEIYTAPFTITETTELWVAATKEGHKDSNIAKATFTKITGGGSSDGGSSVTKYAVTVSSTDNGKVTLDKTSAAKGSVVTITTKANDGYALDTIKATDKDGKEIKLTDKGDGKYTFTMPASKVEVKAAFKQTASKPDQPAKETKTVVVMQIGSKTMFVNGKAYEKDAAPVIMNDRTLVPIRFVTESLGGKVAWNAETKEVTLTIDGKEIKMTIGKTLEKYGVAPVIINDRTFVPVRFVADELGATTAWDAASKTVTITKTEK